MNNEVLGQRALGRALLERQLLPRPVELSPAEVVEHLAAAASSVASEAQRMLDFVAGDAGRREVRFEDAVAEWATLAWTSGSL